LRIGPAGLEAKKNRKNVISYTLVVTRGDGMMEWWNDGGKIKCLNPLFHSSIIPIFQLFKE
jgi:hypothetical protein